MNQRLASRTWWIYALVVIAMIPVMLFRDFTAANELRYLSIADEALRDGHFWCFYNHGLIYADKPPLYLWTVMFSRWLLGGHYMWFVGLFSLIPMLVTGRVMDLWARPWLSVRQRQTALLMLFSCGFFPILGATLRMDMMMTMWITLSMWQVYRMTRGTVTRGGSALLGLFVFLGLFTKGPLGVAFPLLASVVWLLWERRGRMFFRIWGWPCWLVLLGGCAIWWGCVYAEGGDVYLNNLLFHQTVDRAHNAFHHKRPFYYYAIAFWYVMAPWSLLWLWQAIRHGREAAATDMRRMCLAVSAVVFVLLSCVSSKLQVYMLPMIPFAVYWSATMPIAPAMVKVIRGFAYAFYTILFVGGFFCCYINPLFGYGEGAREAAATGAGTVLIDKNIFRGENIDAYFGHPVDVVDSSDSTFVLAPGTALITKDYDSRKRVRVIYQAN